MSMLKKSLILCLLFLFTFSPISFHLSFSLFTFNPVFGNEKKVETIEVEIIKEKGEEEKSKIIYDPAKIEKARKITKARILGLLAFWSIVLILFILIQITLKHEKCLLEKGYYETDLNH